MRCGLHTDWLWRGVNKRLREELNHLQVHINKEKTKHLDLAEGESFGFLGFDFRRLKTRTGKCGVYYQPKMQARAKLIDKIRDVFQQHVSQPLTRVRDLINPILRGWVQSAHAALAELKGIASTIPNQNILINTLGLQEAKDSSAIENIITTHDDLYKTGLNLDAFKSLQAKEVQNYISALKKGFELISKTGLLTNNSILQIQEILEDNKAGFRKLPGTALKNVATGETIYTPPQDYDTIMGLMANLEHYINDSEMQDCDPLTPD